MGLSEMQRELALLLTDADMRERFAADPQGVEQSLNLSMEARAQRVLPSDAEVERFARSLCAKRWNEIQKLLPVSTQGAQSVGFPLRRAFLQFAQEYTPQGSKRHARDAIAFADWVGRQPKETFQDAGGTYYKANAAWLPDLIRYEAAWLEMQITPTRFWMLRRFAYPVPLLARAVSQSQPGDATMDNLLSGLLSARPIFVIWLRLSPNGRLRNCSLSLPAPAASSAALKKSIWTE